MIMMMKMTMTMVLLVEIRDDVEDDDLLGRKGYTMMMVMVMTMIMMIMMRLTTFTGEEVALVAVGHHDALVGTEARAEDRPDGKNCEGGNHNDVVGGDYDGDDGNFFW